NFAAFDTNSDGYLSNNELHIAVVVRGDEGSYAGTSCGTPSTWAHKWALGFGAVSAPTVDTVVVGHSGAHGSYVQEGEWHERCPSDTPGHKPNIGVMSEELGHDMGTGMPDLYDTATGTGTNSYGVGNWALQGGGSWNTTASNPAGQSPSWPDAYARWWYGF